MVGYSSLAGGEFWAWALDLQHGILNDEWDILIILRAMVSILTLSGFGDDAVAGCDHLNYHDVVYGDQDFKRIRAEITQWPALITVIPTAVGNDGNADNMADSNQMLYYVLKPIDEQMTKEERLAVWSETQLGMKEFKEFVRLQQDGGDYEDLFFDLNFSSREQNPEYNVLGCVGWSLLFDFNTPGL
jgi:hypothetical protein